MNDDDTRWVKPLHPRIPKLGGGVLATGGEQVAWENYWERRLADEDIALMTPEEITVAEGEHVG